MELILISILLITVASLAILIFGLLKLTRITKISTCEKQNYEKLQSPMYVNCNSNCSAFAQTPTDYNLSTDFGPGSCASCLTDYGEETLPCDYVNNYEDSLSASTFCSAYNDIKKNGNCDPMTLDSWQYASGGRCT